MTGSRYLSKPAKFLISARIAAELMVGSLVVWVSVPTRTALASQAAVPSRLKKVKVNNRAEHTVA